MRNFLRLLPLSLIVSSLCSMELPHNNSVHEDLNEVIKDSATLSTNKTVMGSYSKYPCSVIISPDVMAYKNNGSRWEIYNQKTKKKSGKISEMVCELAISPDDDHIALLDGFGSITVYALAKLMAYDLDDQEAEKLDTEPLIRDHVHDHRASIQFTDAKTLLVFVDKKLYALDLALKSRSLIRDFSGEVWYRPTLIYGAPNQHLCVYNEKKTNDYCIGSLSKTSQEWFFDKSIVRKELGKHGCRGLAVFAYHRSGAALIEFGYEVRLYPDIIKARDAYASLKYSPYVATFSPDGERIALLSKQYTKNGIEDHIMVVGPVGSDTPTVLWKHCKPAINSYSLSLCWPSYEIGIINAEQEGGISQYNTAAAGLLAQYKKLLEQNNNNTK